MKVLVSDNLGKAGIDLFQQAEGICVDVRPGLPPDELRRIIGAYDALVVRSATKVTAELLAAATRLKVIGRAGIGLDNVDVAAATTYGVIVMNTPGGNTVTTAEHAISMMLALSRHIPEGTASLKAGRWDKKKLLGREIYNKVLGVIGFGRIGSIVADRGRGLKMQVVVHDPYVQPERIEKAGFQCVSLEELYRQADYITVHVPRLKETAGMIDATAFAQMRDGVMLINCARGGIVDEADLCDALKSGRVGGAALDVFATEPPGESPLFEFDNFICTPHLGASTLEAQTNVAMAVADQIIDFLQNGTVSNAVNAPSVTGELLYKLRPFLNIAEKIGCLHAQLATGPIKEVAIEYAGDFQGLDLSPVSAAVLKGLLTPAVKDAINFVNAQHVAQQRDIRVSETTSSESEDYINLISVHSVTTEGMNSVSGTIFGKNKTRIVKINNFRLEMIPKGHLALIYNIDKPGSLGQIGTTLGRHGINIGRMQVGQEEDGDRNIIFMSTDTPIPPPVVAELNQLSLVRTVIPLEF